jgi:hypothetical protein
MHTTAAQKQQHLIQLQLFMQPALCLLIALEGIITVVDGNRKLVRCCFMLLCCWPFLPGSWYSLRPSQ